MDSQEIMDFENIMGSEDIMDSDIMDSDILDSNILDSNNDFITPSKNFGIYWTGFLHSKEFKNDKARQYNT
ncbi:21688_t:CDS:1, partial [Dentiscutata erythropus]